MIKNCLRFFKIYGVQQNFSRKKTLIDKSCTPILNEKDLEEHFVKGSGPGGSKVNKAVNCVYLHHKPTGLFVKVHEQRELHINRKLAREKLINKLDNYFNKEKSVENQLEKINIEKLKKKNRKQKKLFEMKAKWKANLQEVLMMDKAFDKKN